MNPPYESIPAFLDHYRSLKDRHPGLSACFLLPAWQHRPWWKKAEQDWDKVTVWRKGSRLFDWPTPNGRSPTPRGTPWPVGLFYDPPRENSPLPQALLTAKQQGVSLSLRYRGRVGDVTGTILVDTGDSHAAFILNSVSAAGSQLNQSPLPYRCEGDSSYL